MSYQKYSREVNPGLALLDPWLNLTYYYSDLLIGTLSGLNQAKNNGTIIPLKKKYSLLHDFYDTLWRFSYTIQVACERKHQAATHYGFFMFAIQYQKRFALSCDNKFAKCMGMNFELSCHIRDNQLISDDWEKLAELCRKEKEINSKKALFYRKQLQKLSFTKTSLQ